MLQTFIASFFNILQHVQSTELLPNFLKWKLRISINFFTRQLDEITAFYAVYCLIYSSTHSISRNEYTDEKKSGILEYLHSTWYYSSYLTCTVHHYSNTEFLDLQTEVPRKVVKNDLKKILRGFFIYWTNNLRWADTSYSVYAMCLLDAKHQQTFLFWRKTFGKTNLNVRVYLVSIFTLRQANFILPYSSLHKICSRSFLSLVFLRLRWLCRVKANLTWTIINIISSDFF